MATTGVLFPGSVANRTIIRPWVNPGNSTAFDTMVTSFTRAFGFGNPSGLVAISFDLSGISLDDEIVSIKSYCYDKICSVSGAFSSMSLWMDGSPGVSNDGGNIATPTGFPQLITYTFSSPGLTAADILGASSFGATMHDQVPGGGLSISHDALALEIIFRRIHRVSVIL